MKSIKLPDAEFSIKSHYTIDALLSKLNLFILT